MRPATTSRGTPPPRPARRRRIVGIIVGTLAIVAAVVTSGLLKASASAAPTGVVLSGSPSNFESGDGDMTAQYTTNGSSDNDWNTVAGTCKATAPNTRPSSPCSAGNYVHLSDLSSGAATDLAWTSGQKQDQVVCPSLQGSNVPGKDDFMDVASYNETAVSGSSLGDTFLYGGTIRQVSNGDSAENVELQMSKYPSTYPTIALRGTAVTVCFNTTTGQKLYDRIDGDKMIAIDYLNGGVNVQFGILTWIISNTEGSCAVKTDTAPCWRQDAQFDNVKTTLSYANGLANPNGILAADNGINGNALVAQQFAEFGLNLSDSHVNIVPAGTCSVFANVIWESRTSGSSFTSNPEDEEIEQHSTSNCGEIKITKATTPAGANQTFDYTSGLPASSTAGGVACPTTAGVQSGGGFCLNADTTDNGTHANSVDETGLPPGSYNVDETPMPSGWELDPTLGVSCVSSDPNATEPSSTSNPAITVNLTAGALVQCTYNNLQMTGAIQVTKTSSKAAATPLDNAVFEVCTNNGPYTLANPCVAAKTGSDSLTTSGTGGTACVDGLTFGKYYVTEKTAPSGYAIDDTTTHSVSVSTSAKCSDSPFDGNALTFTDTPLTDISASAKSEATGGTQSTITCTGPSPSASNVGNSPQGPAASPSVSATGLLPGVYTCTINIDP